MTHAPMRLFVIGFCSVTLAATGCAGGSSGAGTGGSSGAGTGGSSGGTSTGTGGLSGTGAGGAGANGTGGTNVTGTGGANVTGTGGTNSTGTGGGNSTGGSTGSGGSGGCASLPLCETFESSTIGAAPNSALWTVINGNGSSDTAAIDGIGANGTSKSVKLTSGDRIYIRNSIIGTISPVAHVRFYVRFMMALPTGHAALMATHPTPADQYTQTPEFRFGSQDMVFHWNNTQGDADIPDVAPQGDPLSFMPAANTWYCLELTINTSNGHLNASVDGNDIAGLTEDGVSTQYVDDTWLATADITSTYSTLADFSLGWASYGGGGMVLWFDEIALSPNPIGCN